MRRRNVLTLLGGAVAAWPIIGRAQQPALPVIGYLQAGSLEASPHLVAAFRQGLSEAGFTEGRNVAIEYRWAQNEAARLPELAADLVRRRVAVIATPGSGLSASAAKAATSTIPIIFSVAGDPVQLGLVTSLNRPGGNATGFAELSREIASKRLGLMHELIPGATRFALLLSPSILSPASDITELQAAASANGLQMEVLHADATIRDIDLSFATLVQKRVDALLVSPSAQFFTFRAPFAALAARYAVPTIYWDRGLVEAGGLMSYGTSIADQFRQVGIYTGRVLKGEKPANLPVQQPTKFELVINLKALKALGLTIPPTLFAIADEVIE